jgi:predicted O-linked N-acetylglucosamine transferase (SPINDLY family)
MLEYMNVASVADFALDSVPVSGGVTTLHALWMGLPVLTMTPNNGIAMQTYSGNTLRLVGLDTCITRSPQEVVARAGEWIQNPALIGALRERTRSNLLSSPFMDHETRVRELESCFREMWRRFLHNEPVTDLSVR